MDESSNNGSNIERGGQLTSERVVETLPVAASEAVIDQPKDNQPATVTPKISATDVAAAIAAMPAPAGTPLAPAPAVPIMAADVDKIEKEWVDAAEEVIRRNATAPYAEEEGIENLQVEYLKRRYGKVVDKKPSQ